jgi:isoleucyl-tRNA synthetase
MLAENMNFSEKGVEEALRKNIMLLLNVYSFYAMYAGDEVAKADSQNVLDAWIIAKLNHLISDVTKGMEEYNLPKSMRAITEFIDELSTWYLRRSRDRFKEAGDDKLQALQTMKYVLIELSKVMAPFMPFVSELLWQKVTGLNFIDEKSSVHLEKWPAAGIVNVDIISEMETVRKVVEMGLAARDAAKIKIRQPLQKIIVSEIAIENKELVNLIIDELNIKEVQFSEGALEKVELDTTMTPELEREGLKREIVRLVNGMRKENGMTIQDRISLTWFSDDELVVKTMEEYGEQIKTDVLATDIKMEKIEGMTESKVNNKVLSLTINKI